MLALMFRHEAEVAVKSYVSLFSPLFGISKILSVTYYGEEELEAPFTASAVRSEWIYRFFRNQ
jgi:predicted 3-demethylubiquinone-9 3-methyltransferase (glyoxalase superfamily)